MDLRGTQSNKQSFKQNEFTMSSGINFRGGTSATHMRNLTDFEINQTNNKYFFSQYKEARKEMAALRNQQFYGANSSNFQGGEQQFNQSNKRPRTNSPFPLMKVNNLQYNQQFINQDLIDRLAASENLMLSGAANHYNIQNAVAGGLIDTPQLHPVFSAGGHPHSHLTSGLGLYEQHVMTPPLRSTNAGQNGIGMQPLPSNSSVNTSQQNTSTNSKAKAFFQRNENNGLFSGSQNQKMAATFEMSNQAAALINASQDITDSMFFDDDLRMQHQQICNTSIGIIKQLNNYSLQQHPHDSTPQSRNGLNHFFSVPQRSMSTEQSKLSSHGGSIGGGGRMNGVSNESRFLSNPLSENRNPLEMNSKINVKLEPINKLASRHQRNKSFNDNQEAAKNSLGNSFVNLNSNLSLNYRKNTTVGQNTTAALIPPEKVMIKAYLSPNKQHSHDISKNLQHIFERESIINGEGQPNNSQIDNNWIINNTTLLNGQNPIYRTTDRRSGNVSKMNSNNYDEILGTDPSEFNSSFRVENRRARPKIVKNVNNICNIFIFNNSGSNSLSNAQSQERKKRRIQNSSINIVPTLKQSLQQQSRSNTQKVSALLNNSSISEQLANANIQSELNSSVETNTNQTPSKKDDEGQSGSAATHPKDPYYFTFFKEKQDDADKNEVSPLQNANFALKRPETMLSDGIDSIAENMNQYPKNNSTTPQVSNSKLPAFVKTQPQDSLHQTPLQGEGRSRMIVAEYSLPQSSAFINQKLKRTSIMKPQSPKKHFPQCFLDVSMSEQQAALSRIIKPQQLTETPKMSESEETAATEYSQEQSFVGRDSIGTNSNNGSNQLIIKNNKVYIPQKMINRLNERATRQKDDKSSTPQKQLIIREVAEH